ncbi:MAG: hypothetical protein IKM44_02250 [Clostridia bacterium]|nr:hypothetical protein [Clostridia bacterium]
MPNCCHDDKFPCRIATRLIRIYDGGLRETRDSYSLPLEFVTAPIYPLTLTSASFEGKATVTNVSVGNSRGNRRLVDVDYTFPVTVIYVDANGVTGRAYTSISGSISAFLRLPDQAYSVELGVRFISRTGRISGDTLQISGCMRMTVRVLTEFDAVINVSEINYPYLLTPENLSCSALFDD